MCFYSIIHSFFNLDEDALKLIELHHKYPMIKICIGLHPCEASEEQLSRMIQLIDQYHNEIVGIGEIGLDFSTYYIRNDPDVFLLSQYDLRVECEAIADSSIKRAM